MITLWVDKEKRKIKLQTDDSSVRYLLESSRVERRYSPWKKKMDDMKVTEKIFDNRRVESHNGIFTFSFGLGWGAYLINVFKNYISPDDYAEVINALTADSYRDVPFPELRDYQNEDVLHLLKYKIGLYGVYTSYGKTQVIATLANYFYNLGKSVLLVTPNKKPNEELVKRCKNAFNLEVPSKDLRINNIITSGLLNRTEVKDSNLLKELEKLWAKYEIVLVDEVEYTINPGGMFLYDRLVGAERMYGFSGTADKTGGECISFIEGLNETVMRNKNLIKYFGPSLVYRMPLSIDIDIIRIMTSSLDNIRFENSDFSEKTNVYLNVMTRIWTTPEVCKALVAAGKKYPMMYIPMNNLANIIYEWIEGYFIHTFRILLICHEGYIYYDLQGNKTKLKNLEEACEYVKNGMVDIIPSTSSGFRALDLPGLENICLIAGKVAGVTLQTVGRVARGAHMNIISFQPASDKKIPVYSNGMEERDAMLHDYYKYCNITDSMIYEENL